MQKNITLIIFFTFLLVMIILPPIVYGANLRKTVCPEGSNPTCDYTNLADCINNNNQNLVSGGNTFECLITKTDKDWLSPDTSHVVIKGCKEAGNPWCTGPGNELYITVDDSVRHDGKWNTNKYLLSAPLDELIEIREGYVVLNGLQAYAPGANYGITLHDPNSDCSTNNVQIKNTLIKVDGGVNSAGIWTHYQIGGDLYVYNTIVFSSDASKNPSSEGIYWRAGSGSSCGVSQVAELYLLNSVVKNFDDGIERDYGTVYIKNSAVFDNNDDFDGSNIFFTTCASDDADCSIHPADWSTVFNSITLGSENFHLKSTATMLISAGTDNVGNGLYLDDIDNEIRTSPWDIGADEYTNVPITYECNDIIDNDNDGFIDLFDLGCTSILDKDESNCGDNICEGNEDCLNCAIDCGFNFSSEVCCLGEVITGNCCSDVDCNSQEICSSNTCTAPPKCEQDNDNDQYGIGLFCLGFDCNDNNSNLNQNILCTFNGTDCGSFIMCVESCPVDTQDVCQITKKITSVIREDCNNYLGIEPCYTSLFNWESARQRDLVLNNEIEEVRIEGTWIQADKKPIVIDGWTTTPDNYIRIYTDASARHDGKWNTSKYRLEITNNIGIDIKEDYVKIDGLQINLINNAAGSNRIGIRTTYAGLMTDIQISNNIIKGSISGSTLGATGISVGSSDTSVNKVWNNIIYDFYNNQDTSSYKCVSGSNGFVYLYSNTIYSCKIGVSFGSGIEAKVLKNNLVYHDISLNPTFKDYQYVSGATSNNDISSDATSPDTAFRNKIVLFVDKTNKDFHLSSLDTSAKDSGIDLSSDANLAFNTDIDREIRSGFWDIGADEV